MTFSHCLLSLLDALHPAIPSIHAIIADTLRLFRDNWYFSTTCCSVLLLVFLIQHVLSAVIIFRSSRMELCRGAAVPLSSRVTFIIRNIHIRNLHRRCRAILHPASHTCSAHYMEIAWIHHISHLCSHHLPIPHRPYTTRHWIIRDRRMHLVWHVILTSSTRDIANVITRCVIVIDPFRCYYLRSTFSEFPLRKPWRYSSQHAPGSLQTCHVHRAAPRPQSVPVL